MAEPKTICIFRKWKNSVNAAGDGIIALFPEIPSDIAGRYCLSYEHIGQHGGADCIGVIRQTRNATAKEFADLKRELESRGYTLEIRKRVSHKMHQKRWTEAREMRETK